MNPLVWNSTIIAVILASVFGASLFGAKEQEMLDAAVLGLRPTNAMHQLAVGSKAPLFNGRHILKGLPGRGLLWVPKLQHPAAVVGVLRAAAHRRAPIGFGIDARRPGERERLRPAELFQAAVSAALEVDQAPPFALHFEAPSVTDENREVEHARDLVAEAVQAGYTSFGLDLSGCRPEKIISVARQVLEAALLLELAVALELPAGAEADQKALLAGLAKASVQVDLLVVAGPGSPGAPEDLSVLAAAVAPCRLARRGELPRGHPPAAIAAHFGGPSFEPADPARAADPDRVEAFAYAGALGCLDSLGCQGAAKPVLHALVAQCG